MSAILNPKYDVINSKYKDLILFPKFISPYCIDLLKLCKFSNRNAEQEFEQVYDELQQFLKSSVNP
jgi:hypothetical protein